MRARQKLAIGLNNGYISPRDNRFFVAKQQSVAVPFASWNDCRNRSDSHMSRFKNLDCLKAVAMFGVLTMHVPSNEKTLSVTWMFFNQFNRFAVPCFFLVSGFFFARSFQNADDKRAVILRYASRLLFLFLFWAIFYAVTPPFGSEPPYPTPVAWDHLSYIAHHPRMFLVAGYVVHLWFISSLVQGLCLVWLCLYIRLPWLALAAGAALFSLALLGEPYAQVVGWKWTFDMKEGPFYSTLFVALGALTAFRQWRLSPTAASLLALVGLITEWTEDWLMQDPSRGIGIASHNFTLGTLPWAAGIFFLMLSLPDKGPAWLARIGMYSLGVYALHIYVQKVLLLTSFGSALLWTPLIFLAAVYAISLAVSMLLARVAYVRRLVV